MCCSDIVDLVVSGYKSAVFVREQVEPILHLMYFNHLENPLSIGGKKISNLSTHSRATTTSNTLALCYQHRKLYPQPPAV